MFEKSGFIGPSESASSGHVIVGAAVFWDVPVQCGRPPRAFHTAAPAVDADPDADRGAGALPEPALGLPRIPAALERGLELPSALRSEAHTRSVFDTSLLARW